MVMLYIIQGILFFYEAKENDFPTWKSPVTVIGRDETQKSFAYISKLLQLLT